MKNKLKNLYRKTESVYLRLTEFPMQELEKEIPAHVKNEDILIPPMVYQTWENNFFGKTHLQEIKKFRALNPDMSFKLLDKDELEGYMKSFWGHHPIYEIFQKAKYGPMKVDIFRYCILFERGGFYFDINKGLSVPISSLVNHKNDGLVAFEQNDCYLPPDDCDIGKILYPTKYVVQWGFGFTKGHPILENMINAICANYENFKPLVFPSPKIGILAFTATGRFTKVVRSQIGSNPKINVVQAGIDFNGSGIYVMPGSRARYLVKRAYTDYSNDGLFE